MAERLQLVIQAGHVGRTRGATGARGLPQFGTEQMWTHKTAVHCQHWLTLRGWTVEWTKADDHVPDSDVFIAVHHDGARSAYARGPSVGYPSSDDSKAAAQVWKAAYNAHYPGPAFRPDNYTSGLRGYYGYRKSTADIKLCCEHGFGSNPDDAAFMWSADGQDAAVDAMEAVLLAHLGIAARKTPEEVHALLSPGAPAAPRTQAKPIENPDSLKSQGSTFEEPARLLRHTSPPHSGGDVRTLQQQLAQLGYDPGPFDGIFGPKTGQAVRAFQTHANLVVDGIVGPNTRHELQAALQWQSSRGKGQDPKHDPDTDASAHLPGGVQAPSERVATVEGSAEGPGASPAAPPDEPPDPGGLPAAGTTPATEQPDTVHPVTDDTIKRASHTGWQATIAGAIYALLHEGPAEIDPQHLIDESELVVAITVLSTLFSVVKTWIAGRRK